MSSTNTFPFIQQQIIRCFFSSYLLFGNIFNCLVFYQKSLRGSSCSIYFLVLSITNLILLDYAVSTRFYSNEQPNPNSYSLLHCKLNLYLVHTLLMISRTYIILISIDRFCMCSSSAFIRRFSTRHNALRVVIIVPFFWLIMAIHIPIFNFIQSQRCIMPGIYSFLYSIYSLCVAGIFPPLLMIIFTLLTYRSMRQMRARIIPISLTIQMRIHKRDHQLFGISVYQIIVYILSAWLYPGTTFYFAFVKKGDPQTTTELFLNLFGSTLLVYLNSSVTFFIYVSRSETHKSSTIQTRSWDEAIALARDFVMQMTLEEKCNMTAGVKGHCVGVVLSVARLNFSGLCLLDSASGVGDDAEFSTAFPPGIQIAATWDRDLFYRRAAAIGREFRGKGIHFVLGPMMNIDRNARHGRNWEGFGADPYLSGENSFYFVQGLQDQGVVATAKHYICNEQETHRHSYVNRDPGYSANLDDKTMHEIYLWPFADSVAAGVGSVMCAYNQVNGTLACQNNKTLNGLLKGELEFHGNVVSDWNAVRNGVEAALGGLDLDMPGFDELMGYSLLSSVKNGTISETRLNDMIVRILTPYYLLGQDQNYPSHNSSLDMTADHYLINRQVGAAGMILLKNTKNILPFNINTDKYFSIYGSAASRYDIGLDPRDVDGLDGALYQGGGSGFVRSMYFLDPLTSLLIKARDSHIQMQYVINQDDYTAINRSLVDAIFSKGKCLVFINAWSSEGRDRTNLSAYHDGDKLVKTVASFCASTIVIVNSVSQLNLEAWIDHHNVTGAIWSGLPGPEYGSAIVDILFGDYNPGGKLVFTIAKNDSDYGTDITETDNSNYTEGVFIDYRHFDRYNITPRYYFGYGLSYTTFSFSKLIIAKANRDNDGDESIIRRRQTRSYTNKALMKFYEPVYTITFTITNTGSVDGSETPQLYLGFPEEAAEPLKILRGFERVYLMAGESKMVILALTERDISYWNVIKQQWNIASGKYTVWISTSANTADIKLESSFII